MGYLLLLVVLLGSYGLGRLLLPQLSATARWSDIGARLAVGVLGLVPIACLYFMANLPSWTAVVLFVGLAAYGIWREVSEPGRLVSLRFDGWSLAGGLGVFIAVFLPFFTHVYHIGFGEFPEVTYNVDAAYFLQFVHGLVEQGGYPPPFLLGDAPGFNYHYGAIMVAALMADATSLSPHIPFLIVVPLLLLVGHASLMALIARSVGVAERYVNLVVLLALLGATQDYTNYVKNWGNIVIWMGNKFYTNHVQIATSTGFLIGLLLFYCCLNFQRRWAKYLIAGGLALLPFVKLPYAPILGVGCGLFLAFKAYKTKDWRLLLPAVIGGVGMLAVYYTLVRNPGIGTAIAIAPLQLFDIHQLIHLALTATGLSLFWWFNRKWTAEQKLIWQGLLAFAGPGLALGLLLDFSHRDGIQLFVLAISFAWIGIILLLGLSNWRRGALLLYPAAVLLFPFLASATYGIVVLGTESLGDEYVDNRPIAPALKAIPVAGSVVALNDTYYPANNYLREERQFQVSALYGHRCFNCETYYSVESIPHIESRQTLTDLLTQPTTTAMELSDYKTRFGVTHLLLHKRLPFLRPDGFSVLYEDDYYVVYQL